MSAQLARQRQTAMLSLRSEVYVFGDCVKEGTPIACGCGVDGVGQGTQCGPLGAI